MQILINILAVIGALTLVAFLVLVIAFILCDINEKEKERQPICLITGRKCERPEYAHGTCEDCERADEWKKIGDR